MPLFESVFTKRTLAISEVEELFVIVASTKGENEGVPRPQVRNVRPATTFPRTARRTTASPEA